MLRCDSSPAHPALGYISPLTPVTRRLYDSLYCTHFDFSGVSTTPWKQPLELLTRRTAAAAAATTRVQSEEMNEPCQNPRGMWTFRVMDQNWTGNWKNWVWNPIELKKCHSSVRMKSSRIKHTFKLKSKIRFPLLPSDSFITVS